MFSCYQLCVSERFHWIIVCFIACYLHGYILRTCFLLSLYCTATRMESSSFECYLFSWILLHYITLQHVICRPLHRAFVLLSSLTLTRFIHCKEYRFFVERGLPKVGGCLLFRDLEEFVLENSTYCVLRGGETKKGRRGTRHTTYSISLWFQFHSSLFSKSVKECVHLPPTWTCLRLIAYFCCLV